MSELSPSRHRRGDTPTHVAARQHDLLTHEQLLAFGLSRSAIARRVARGTLHRRFHGVYSLGSAPLSQEARWHAAVLACGDGSGLSHVSCAQIRRVTRSRERLIHVVSPRRRTVPGVRVHHCRTLDPREITSYRGVPVTTFPRMLIDLADVQHSDELANVIHEGAFHGMFSELATRDAMEIAKGRHNLHVLEAALRLHAAGSAGSKSGYERAYRRLIGGLPQPLPNTQVCGWEVDCHWPEHRLVVEIDGPGHARPRSRIKDRRVNRELRAAGYRVLRFTDEDIDRRPEWVVRRTTAALRGA
jgi:hypothetical protein